MRAEVVRKLFGDHGVPEAARGWEPLATAQTALGCAYRRYAAMLNMMLMPTTGDNGLIEFVLHELPPGGPSCKAGRCLSS
eukprot:COSAG01_NODE_1398_length_10466_cov_173.518086_6_plen_80_part_00